MDKTISAHVLLKEKSSAPTIAVSTIVGWGVKAPGNIGAILRLAANFSCPNVLFVEGSGTKHNLRLIRKTAVDAPSHIDWSFLTPERFVREVAPDLKLIGLETSHCSVDLREAVWPQGCALMIGSESRGLPEEAIELCTKVLHIPTCGPLHSLNVSHALAIALYSAACGQPPPAHDSQSR